MKWSRWRNKVLGEGKATENLIRHLEEKTKRKPINCESKRSCNIPGSDIKRSYK